MADQNPSDPTPMVPLSVVDGLLADIAAALHDRPVQSLVAAKLMLESVRDTGMDADNPIYERGLGALTDAGQLSRDVMWALTRMAPQHQRLDASIRDLFDRVGPDGGLEASVSGTEAADPADIELVLQAAHDVVAGVALRSGTLDLITLDHADGVTTCALATTTDGPGRSPDPWLALASIRLARHGGIVTQRQRGSVSRTVLRLR